MKRFGILVCSFVAACNYDTGECYLRGDEGAGAGGSIVVATGAGGFGDVAPQPQDVANPADPCGSQIAECTITWKAGSDTCKAQGIASSCTTLYQCAHATLDDAKKQCEKVYGVGTDAGAQSCDPCQWAHGTQGDPVEQCKKVCDKVNQDCIAHCPKGDKGCMYNCNVEYGKCLKDCKK